MLLAKAGAQNSAYRISRMKFTTHRGDPRTVIHVSLMLIFTTNIVCSHLDGVLKDCVKLEVSQRRLACRVGVGGRGLLVLSVGGGVRERGRCCAGIFSSCSLFWVLQWFGARKNGSGRSACCQVAFTSSARAQID